MTIVIQIHLDTEHVRMERVFVVQYGLETIVQKVMEIKLVLHGNYFEIHVNLDL